MMTERVLVATLMWAALGAAVIGLVIMYLPIKDWNAPFLVRARKVHIGLGFVALALALLLIATWVIE